MAERNFPVPVEEIGDTLPHRGAAVWIDRVSESHERGGECVVVLKSDASYFGPRGVRRTSCLEWMAQAYGYAMACRDANRSGLKRSAKRAFLVGVRDLEFPQPDVFDSLAPGHEVRVQVSRTHEMGPLTLINGTVLFGSLCLAKASLKLFAELG